MPSESERTEFFLLIGFRDGERWDRLIGTVRSREEADKEAEGWSALSEDERPETVMVYRCVLGETEFEEAWEYDVSKETWRKTWPEAP